MTRQIMMLSTVALGVMVYSGCGGEETDATGTASPERSPTEAQPIPEEPALVAADAPAPAGYTFGPSRVSGLTSTQVPTGDGWTANRMGHGESYDNEQTEVTVVIQQQYGVGAEARGEFVDSFVEINERDAPRYSVTSRTDGTVSSHPATRVDGQFNNGQAMVTRDIVMFLRNRAIVVMVRGPEARLAEVQSLADHVASTVQ